jgi:hypothetical protein
MTSSPAHLSRARTFLLWGLAVVWFSEMILSGVRPLTERWTQLWGYFAPGDPRLFLTYATLAAAKGALGVLAVYALRSRRPFVRSVLFVAMALVPPLNVAFPFRAQGFLLRPTMIGATLSVILWQTFLLFHDREEQPGRSIHAGEARSRLTPRDVLRYVWFAANAVMLTVAAALFLFAPDVGVQLAFPCFSAPRDAMPSGVTLTGMVVGTHLTAVAAATWIGTVVSRSNATVRHAVAAANTLHAALLCVLPLGQLALQRGTHCATASPLLYAIPLLAGWLIHGALTYQTTPASRLNLEHPASHSHTLTGGLPT